MKLILIVVGSLLIGFGIGFAADQYFTPSSAPWSQQREMQGCWAAGRDKILVRQGDKKLRFLEARLGDDGTWFRLDTTIEAGRTVATSPGASGTLRLSPNADQLFTFGFSAVPNTDWMRCESIQNSRPK